ncbi:MAG: hypothetical protein J5787_04230 [Alphaproteobacteria bacterium]|nr:hypothetical protein [Alphaproteobacteria bacterium]
MKNIHAQESGRSMIEILGVLAVIGVLSVGGIAGYSHAMSKYKINKTIDQMQTMAQNIRTLFASQKNYEGVDSKANPKMLYAAGILTDENCPDGCSTTPINPYGGVIAIGFTKDDENHSKRGFAIAFSGLPSDVCTRLATQNWGDATSGLIAVEAKSTNVASISKDASIPGNEKPQNNNNIALPFQKSVVAKVAPMETTGSSVALTKNAAVPMSLSAATTGCGTGGNTSSLTLYYK